MRNKSYGNTPYTEEQLNFIKNLYINEEYSCAEIAEKFSETFGRKVTARAIMSIKSKYLREVKKKITHFRAPKQVRDYIATVIDTKSYPEIKKDIKELFNYSYSIDSIADYAKKYLGITNKKNNGQFQKGSAAHNLYEIGDEMERTGYIYVKVAQPGTRVQKQRYIYEQHYGKLADDEFVIFLDGNPKNFNIDNLAKVNRGILAGLNSHNFANKGELTRTAIKFYELAQLVKERNKL